MIDPREIDVPALHRHMGGIQPRSGVYYLTTPHTATNTSNTLGNGTGRFSPWVVNRTMSLSKIGTEVTAAGEAGSLVRLGIYADDGTGYPGALVLDAGTIAGDSVAVQEVTISQVLAPGLYWVGAVVQNAPSTQPRLRTIAGGTWGAIPITNGAAPAADQPGAVAFVGFNMTGAFPALWPTASANVSSVAARVFVKTA